MSPLCDKDSTQHVQEALTILGDKWTALIIQLLHVGPHRFCQLEQKLAHISTRTLSQRLTQLEAKNIIQKKELSESPYHAYVLTDKGKDLDTVIHAMAQWGKRFSQ